MIIARLGALLLLALSLTAAEASAEARDWLDAGRRAVARAKKLERPTGPARNAILFVGDGMGVSTVTAARILEGQLRGESGEENLLSFERLPHLALAKTYNTNQQTPDSAGTMTAMVTGAKTRAGVLSVDEAVARGSHREVEGHRLTSLFERAERRGLSTGVVTTTRLTHATPAACYAQSPERNWEDDSELSEAARAAGFPDIARQLVEYPHGDGIDVALGGGSVNFLPAAGGGKRVGRRRDGRDLVAQWAARHPDGVFVESGAELEAVDPKAARRVLGLFSLSHMQFEADRAGSGSGEPSLTEMTAKAIEILSHNPRGFLLMVEGGRIDHAHHAGNAYRALTDTIEFARAVGRALELTDPRETLLIVTADHSHVFTIAGYPERGNDILGKVRTTDQRGDPGGELARDVLGLPYTTLGYHNGAGFVGPVHREPEDRYHTPGPGGARLPTARGRPDLSDVDTADPDYLQEAAIPTAFETHGGEDVAVYAGGPGAHLVDGVMEQNTLYHVLVEALGWNEHRGRQRSLLPSSAEPGEGAESR
jgi:alkaline phosphatase